jgi:Ca-activated chloride channel family protein
MTDKKALKLKTRWEHDEIPAGSETQRGLLIEVTARETEEEVHEERPPLNLSLVIDRSGSMQGGRLAAACRAAIGISQKLRKKDRLSIVAYDTDILTLLNGVKQNKAGRASARSALFELRTGGCTDLGKGWMAGGKCVAKVMERAGLNSGHVLLLSDGHANRGIMNPGELATHAAEMAARGVTTSCVGIGHDYSPLQLDALAEAGRGQLHHSDNPDEIIDVVMGELGEMTRTAAHAAKFLLHFPDGAELQQLTRFREQDSGHGLELDLGDIPAGRTRRIAFMVHAGKGAEPGEKLPFKAELVWRNAGQEREGFDQGFRLETVDPKEFNPRQKRRKVARIIAELWLARMGYEAMQLNERGQYREAVETFTRNDLALESLVTELSEIEQQRLFDQKRRAQDAVADEWSGASKLQAFSMVKKHVRSEADHSGRETGDWSDRA